MILNSENVIVFTDGSSKGNPGPGGWGVVIVYNDDKFKVESEKLKVKELGGREDHATNNRMEICAAIEAFSYVSNLQLKTYNLKLFSDSSYLVNGIIKWIHGWKKNGWKTKAKEPVENQDLWKALAELTRNKNIEWKLIGGHVGVKGNERCDEIATAFADGLSPKLYDGSLEKYPIKNILDIKVDSEKETKKSGDRSRSRTKAYSYISMIDGVIKTHKTWGECEARVKGKSGAKYKKALSPEEEKEIIKSWKK